jgi:ketosteroid isomerase-like protein
MMVTVRREDAEAWVDRYVAAWRSNEPDDIRSLFSDDARYFTAPHREPWTGVDAIVEGWLDRKDEPGTWDFRSDVIGTDGSVAFVRGWTTSRVEPDCSNLWVITLGPDGRASEFVEWWMELET